jgi:hypothetical protein
VYPSWTPRDIGAALTWLKEALGFEDHRLDKISAVVRVRRPNDPDPTVGRPGEVHGPHSGQGWVHVVVDDIAAHHRRAHSAGATLLGEPHDDGDDHRGYRAQSGREFRELPAPGRCRNVDPRRQPRRPVPLVGPPDEPTVIGDDMPALPWTKATTFEPDHECVIMASRLPLARYRQIPAFMAATMKIRRQLANAEGLIGYALDAKLFGKTFWTLSAWESRAALEAFSNANPHRARIDQMRPHMRPTTFVFWTANASELPPAWAEVRRRVDEQAAKEAS